MPIYHSDGCSQPGNINRKSTIIRPELCPRIISVGTATPPNRYPQEEVIEIFGEKNGKEAAIPVNTCEYCGEENAAKAHSHGLKDRFRYGMRYAFVDLLGDIAKWLAIGIIVGGAISYFVPQAFIENFLGSGWRAMLIMLFIGIPIYICASASTPIAAALIAKGMSPGVALVFLLAGPATNAAGMLTVGKFLGKRSIIIYLASITICAVGFGITLDRIYSVFGIDIKTALGGAGGIFPYYIKTISAVVLIILMINGVIRLKKGHNK